MRPSATRQGVLRCLAKRIADSRVPHPLRVAIDGVDGAGKTTLADELAPLVRERGRPVIRSSVDFFHHPAAHRYRRGRDSAEGYFRDSFDVDTLRSRLLDPLGPGGDRRYRERAFDYRSDRPADSPVEEAAPDAVLLFDGVFLQCPALGRCFDLTLFLDVPFEETVARMAQRDGAPPHVDHPDNRRYVGGQRLYLASCEPARRADVVVDNRDLAHPRILRDEPPR